MSSTHNLLAKQLKQFCTESLKQFPWTVIFIDWTGQRYKTGGDSPHWYENMPLEFTVKTPRVARDILALNIMSFLDRYLDDEADIQGNFFLLSEMQKFTKAKLNLKQILYNRIINFRFQNMSEAGKSVKSHYDIPEDSLFYLDQVYKSYSCAIFDQQNNLDRKQAIQIGAGAKDDFDSLEKAQWRKFKNAAEFIAPKENETVLDVGCGYPGFLMTLMDQYKLKKVVGWTHSENQVTVGKSMLKDYDSSRFELNLGDYRKDKNVYDHIQSTGMISHVGPEGPDSGLKNYLAEIRKRIKTGGRYVHHSLMTEESDRGLFEKVGPAFNRKYVWPGFYWYTLGYHIKELERHGFQVVKVLNLSPHYAKTTFAWFERLISDPQKFIEHNGEATYRAWKVYLSGATTSFIHRKLHIYRIFCEAVDTSSQNVELGDPNNQINSV